MIKAILSATLIVLALTADASADKLYGTIIHKDGTKVLKTARISTSWNSKTAHYTANGEYELDFGGKVGKKITIYVNGDTYTQLLVDGDTELNIQLRK